MKLLTALLFTILLLNSHAQTVSTVAGMAGVVGSANGPASSSSFNNPHGVACDPQGNIYIANRYGHTIRKITPGGVVSTFAGSGSAGAGDGQGTAASFNEPWAVVCDTLGNVYVADTKNYKIRKINSGGYVTTIAGAGTFGSTNGPVAVAEFGFPSGLAVSKDGSVIYVADRMTHTIRKIQGGIVSTIAGVVYLPGDVDGPGTTAKFDHPYSLALEASGNILVADEYNNKIKRVSPTGYVTTVAGTGILGSTNGPALSATFNSPWGVCVNGAGDIFIGDANNFTVRKLSQGTVSVYAGQDGIPGYVNGPALQSTFNGVSALWYHAGNDNIYLCDPYSQLVRKISPQVTGGLTIATSSGESTFCVGNPVTLVATPANLTNYTFRDGATVIGTSATATFTTTTLTVGTHMLSCTAVDGNGTTLTSNTITITITSSLLVSIVPSGNTNFCDGDSIILGSSVAGAYLWSTGSTAPYITVASSGTYTLTVTNAQGCSGQSAPLQVTTLSAPVASITSASVVPLCPGDSVLLTAGSATSYQWSNGATTQATYATAPGNYTVMVTNGAGCSAISLPMAVLFHPVTTSTISPSGNVLIPQGSTVTLSANTGTGYLWSTGSTSQTLVVTTPGTYTVTVTDQNGCESTPAVSQVSFISPSNMISANGPTTICEGDSVVLNSVFPSGNQWYRNNVVIPGATQSAYTVTLSGNYKVLNSPISGTPVFSDSIQVTVYTVPNSLVSTGDTVCKGSTAVLSVQPQSGVSYNWYSTSTGGTPLGNGLSFTTPPVSQNTSYYIEIVNSFGCVRANRFEVIAEMYPSPVAAFTHSEPEKNSNGFEVLFSNSSVNGLLYYWDFGDINSPDNTSSLPDPTHLYAEPGDYSVTLIVTTAEGCSDTLIQVVKVVLANNLFVPSGFTPNNDGNNDLFRVRGNNINFYSISIFNQWGQRIWHSPKETNGWDGTANGDYVNNGTYAYAIEVTFDNGTTQVLRGNINVIR